MEVSLVVGVYWTKAGHAHNQNWKAGAIHLEVFDCAGSWTLVLSNPDLIP